MLIPLSLDGSMRVPSEISGWCKVTGPVHAAYWGGQTCLRKMKAKVGSRGVRPVRPVHLHGAKCTED